MNRRGAPLTADTETSLHWQLLDTKEYIRPLLLLLGPRQAVDY